MRISFYVLALLCPTALHGAEPLEPLLTQPTSVVLQKDFSKPETLDKKSWQQRQGTRWKIENGVLRGRESSPEYQAKKKDHFGYEPRLSIPVTPPEFAASFKIRFSGGKETSIVPFIEFGHHVCRIRFSRQGAALLAEHESLKLAEATEFVWKSGKWYEMLAEMKGGHFVLQIKNGPTLYAHHASFTHPPTSGGNGLGVAGPRKGTVEIDDLRIWHIAHSFANGWKQQQSQLPKAQPVSIKKAKKKRD